MRPARSSALPGFTLVEMLVAMAVLAVVMMVVFQITNTTGQAWKRSSGNIESMQGARIAFETITRRLSQATLNAYYAYDNPTSPTKYLRQSELQFVAGKKLVAGQMGHAVFFQAPLGRVSDQTRYGNLGGLLNVCGFYLVYGKDPLRPTFFSNLPHPPVDEYRFRLMECVQPSETGAIYSSLPAPLATIPNNWLAQAVAAGTAANHPLANNIVALIFLPEQNAAGGKVTPLVADYEYDTSPAGAANSTLVNQLPPLVKVVMVAIDEASAIKLGNSATPPPLGMANLFQNTAQLQADLATLEGNLAATSGNAAGNNMTLNFHVFQTDVAIREAKWSQ